ncbi:unnamed protein product [Caretta caretta]
MVHPDQTYTIPGHTVFDNLYLVRDLLELGCRHGLSFAFLSLDQEKAFNRVDHGYLLGTLSLKTYFDLFPEIRIILESRNEKYGEVEGPTPSTLYMCTCNLAEFPTAKATVV